MKKIKFIPIIIIITAIMAVVSVVPYFASSYTYYNGYKYRDITSSTAALSGWDDRSDELIIPAKIITKKITAIDDYAFFNDSVITSVDFSGATNLTYIGTGAFYGCGSITEITLPSWITTMSNSMFQGCSSLESVTLEGEVTKINAQMFLDCTSLSSFVLPETVSEIESYAFANCAALEYVEVPRNVTSIQPSSFQNCPDLTLGVYYDSYAYNYARDNTIPYVLLDGIMLGDANGDDSVNVNDVTAIQRHVAELEELEGIYLHAADINCDGATDIDDATELQLYLAEYDTEYNIGQVMTQ